MARLPRSRPALRRQGWPHPPLHFQEDEAPTHNKSEGPENHLDHCVEADEQEDKI